MDYSFTRDLHVLDSDDASDFVNDLSKKIVSEMKKQEKVETNEYNTDGILNVAMTIQNCFNGNAWICSEITDYAKDFIPRFEKYMEEQANLKWYDKEDTVKDIKAGEKNKQKHLEAYRKILANIKKIVENY